MADISQKLIARLGADLSDYKKKLRKAVTEARSAGRLIKSSMARATQAARTLAKGVGLIALALTGIGALAVREFIQWEEALTGVAKTVDATEEEIRALGQTFVEMSEVIPVGAVELAKLGEVAGQLGVELPNIKEFVEVAAALGVTTNLSAEEAATGLARFSNVMGTATEDVGRLGATVVDLGNNMATTEAEILDMAQRISSTGRLIRLSEAEVLSFAGALSSLGIRSEEGGSAISRVFAELQKSVKTGSDELGVFARVAGKSIADFKVLFETDAAEAVLVFLEGLNRLEEAGGNVFGTLEELGFQNIRTTKLLTSAGAGADKVREAINRGNIAWRENTALTEEAAKFYDRTGARLVALRNKLSNVAAEFGEALVPVVEESIRVVAGFLDEVRKSAPALGEFAEKAAQSIPAMAEKVVNSIGSIGLKLLSVVDFFADNPLVGGLGLVGLVFLGPTGAAAFGTIGFVIEAAIAKLGGAQTVADALNAKLQDSIDNQAELIRQANLLESPAGLLGPGVGGTDERLAQAVALREEAALLGDSISGIKRTIASLTTEDFVALGEEGTSVLTSLTDGARGFLQEMENFKVVVAGGGEGEGIQEVVAGVAEEFDTMRMKFEPLPRLTGEVSANLEVARFNTADWADEATAVANAISSGVGSALGDILTGVKSVTGAIVQLGKTIIRSVVSALVQAIIKAVILRSIFAAFGIPVPVAGFASGGVVPGPASKAVPAILHGGEVVLNANTVSRMGGPSQANALNTGGGGPQEIAIRMELPDAASLPSPGDFGVIASQPQMIRLFVEMMRQAKFVGAVQG